MSPVIVLGDEKKSSDVSTPIFMKCYEHQSGAQKMWFTSYFIINKRVDVGTNLPTRNNDVISRSTFLIDETKIYVDYEVNPKGLYESDWLVQSYKVEIHRYTGVYIGIGEYQYKTGPSNKISFNGFCENESVSKKF
jgi:hypothetical protein